MRETFPEVSSTIGPTGTAGGSGGRGVPGGTVMASRCTLSPIQRNGEVITSLS